jgi:hypothetical protein
MSWTPPPSFIAKIIPELGDSGIQLKAKDDSKFLASWTHGPDPLPIKHHNFLRNSLEVSPKQIIIDSILSCLAMHTLHCNR